MGSLSQSKLPMIDFSKQQLKQNISYWESKCNEVVAALEEYGCFIATYDGFSMELHDAIFRASKQLFDLPKETKVLNTSDTPSHGYVGQQSVIPLYEGLGIEDSTTLEGAQKFTNVMWPLGNDIFRETALSYAKIISEIDEMVMGMVCKRYGIEKEYETLVGSMSCLLRFMKYRGPEKNETDVGIIPHTDKSFMSILHQPLVKGLEIKAKDKQEEEQEEWIAIDPSPSSFIIMAGEACMAWTNGRIEPPVHRVIMVGDEERYSLGLFTFIRDIIIRTPQQLVDHEHPLQYNPFYHYKFLDFYNTLQGLRSKCAIKSYCGV